MPLSNEIQTDRSFVPNALGGPSSVAGLRMKFPSTSSHFPSAAAEEEEEVAVVVCRSGVVLLVSAYVLKSALPGPVGPGVLATIERRLSCLAAIFLLVVVMELSFSTNKGLLL